MVTTDRIYLAFDLGVNQAAEAYRVKHQWSNKGTGRSAARKYRLAATLDTNRNRSGFCGN